MKIKKIQCYSVKRNTLEFNNKDERDAEGKCLHDALKESLILLCVDENCNYKINVSNNKWISKNKEVKVNDKKEIIEKIYL